MARTQLAPARPSQVTDLRFVMPALGSEGSCHPRGETHPDLQICTAGLPSSSWLSHSQGSRVRGSHRTRMGKHTPGRLPAQRLRGPSPSAPHSCSTGGFCVEMRPVREERGRGASVSAPAPPHCPLWPLQKPEVLALGWGGAASCFSCVGAAECWGNLWDR